MYSSLTEDCTRRSTSRPDVYEFELGCDEGLTELATLLPDGNGFVNDLYADGDRLLVTESFGGTVYEVPLDCGDPTAWVQNALLNTENFGTNGITRIGTNVYVTVTRGGWCRPNRPYSRRVKTVVEGGPLSFPSEVIFDLTADGKVFICNFSQSAPENAGVLRTHP